MSSIACKKGIQKTNTITNNRVYNNNININIDIQNYYNFMFMGIPIFPLIKTKHLIIDEVKFTLDKKSNDIGAYIKIMYFNNNFQNMNNSMEWMQDSFKIIIPEIFKTLDKSIKKFVKKKKNREEYPNQCKILENLCNVFGNSFNNSGTNICKLIEEQIKIALAKYNEMHPEENNMRLLAPPDTDSDSDTEPERKTTKKPKIRQLDSDYEDSESESERISKKKVPQKTKKIDSGFNFQSDSETEVEKKDEKKSEKKSEKKIEKKIKKKTVKKITRKPKAIKSDSDSESDSEKKSKKKTKKK